MADDHQLRAFRYSETLTLGIYRTTDRWPRDLGDTLCGRLRLLTPAISDCILDGCSWTGPAARSSWQTAARLLERLSDALDQAERLGLLDPEANLELLEAQSGALVEVLHVLEQNPQEEGAGSTELPTPPLDAREETLLRAA